MGNQSNKAVGIQIPLPLLKRDIGLGGFVKAALAKAGVRPCGGCNERAAALDRKLVFKKKN